MLLGASANQHRYAWVICNDEQVAGGSEQLRRGRTGQLRSRRLVELLGAECRQHSGMVEQHRCATKGNEWRQRNKWNGT